MSGVNQVPLNPPRPSNLPNPASTLTWRVLRAGGFLLDGGGMFGLIPRTMWSKWVAPDALADVILFLASDASRAVHGALVPVTGLS